MPYGSMCLIPRFTAEEWPDIEYEFLPASNTQVEENMYKLVHVNALPITSGQCGTHMGISCYPFSSCGGAGIYFHIHMNNIWLKIWKSVDYMSSTYLISRKQHVDFKIFCIYLKLKSHEVAFVSLIQITSEIHWRSTGRIYYCCISLQWISSCETLF